MLDRIDNLIFKWCPVYTLANLSCACWISSLDDETCITSNGTFNVSVEESAVVLVTSSQCEEVFASFGAQLAE